MLNIDEIIATKKAKEIEKMASHSIVMKNGSFKEAHKMFGVKSMYELLNTRCVGDEERGVNLMSKNFKHVDLELRVKLLEIKKHIHSAQLQAFLISQKSGCAIRIEDTPYFQNFLLPALKAYDSTDFVQWLPTIQSRFYFEELEVPPGIAELFPQIAMQSPIVDVEVLTSRLRGRLESDGATFGAQAQTTSEVLMRAKNNVCHVSLTEDLIADADPSIFDAVRKECAVALQRSHDGAIINGDDSGSHQDTDIRGGAATLFEKAFDGLRLKALANTANGSVHDHLGAGVNLSLFQQLIRKMGKAGQNPREVKFILGVSNGLDYRTGTVAELLPAQNTMLGGQLDSGALRPILGSDVVMSEEVREVLNESGVYEAAHNFTSVLAVNVNRFRYGTMSPVKIWAAPSLPSSDSMLMTAKERIAFNGAAQGASEKSVVIAVDVDPSV
jgi:hypothetical protein